MPGRSVPASKKMFSAPNRPLSSRYSADAANGMSSCR